MKLSSPIAGELTEQKAGRGLKGMLSSEFQEDNVFRLSKYPTPQSGPSR